MELPAIIEALLIASEDPLPSPEIARLIRARVAEVEDSLTIDAEDDTSPTLPEDLAAVAAVNEDEVTAAITQLNHSYETTGRSFLCIQRAKGWKIFTRPEFADFVRHLFPEKKPSRLSAPAMETLAIVAYRQPVTKASIEAVRGVSCDGMLQKLLDRELIKIGGRAELPGRPLLYETTDLFFEHFGVNSVEELPNASELRSVKLPEPETEQEPGKADTSSDDTPDAEQQLALTAAGVPCPEPATTDEKE